jgi:hypothetical protein
MPKPNPQRRPPSPPPAAMDPQVENPQTMDTCINLFLWYVYHYLPDPPVSPAARLSLSSDVVDPRWRRPYQPPAGRAPLEHRLAPSRQRRRAQRPSPRAGAICRSVPLSLVDSHLLPDCRAARARDRPGFTQGRAQDFDNGYSKSFSYQTTPSVF